MRDLEQQPVFVAPMLLKSGPVPCGEAWALEIKWDGCRAQLRYDGRLVSLRTRHGRECLADFPELVDLAAVLGKHRVTLEPIRLARREPRDGGRGELIEALEEQVAGLAARRRGTVTWYSPTVSVLASCHGLPGGPVRDALLRAVVVA